jgi:hypothetical protein
MNLHREPGSSIACQTDETGVIEEREPRRFPILTPDSLFLSE